MTITALKCPHCEAETTKNGQAFKNMSALNTHINMHCPKKPQKAAPTACVHKIALLNSNHAVMLAAINAGHTTYCTKCGDLQ